MFRYFMQVSTLNVSLTLFGRTNKGESVGVDFYAANKREDCAFVVTVRLKRTHNDIPHSPVIVTKLRIVVLKKVTVFNTVIYNNVKH